MKISSDNLYRMLKGNEKFISKITVIGKAPEGWSSPDIVEIQYNTTTLTGFLKDTEQQGNKNAIEIILNRVGKKLDVAMADTVGVFSDDSYSDLIAIISISVVTKPSERFVSFREMRDQLFFDYKAGLLLSNEWMNRWILIRERKRFLPPDMWEVDAISQQDYADCVLFAFEVLRLYCGKHKLQSDCFETDYIKMMLFDILIGQADRTPSNYGIIVDTSRNNTHLAPLFDNSTLTKPYIQKNVVSFNHLLLERHQAAQVVFEMFNDSAIAFRSDLRKHLEDIWEIINSTFYNTETRDFFTKQIEEGVRIIESL